MKLTKTQRAYLKSAAINPIGKTCIAGGTETGKKLAAKGMMKHCYWNVWEITAAGRAALAQGGGE